MIKFIKNPSVEAPAQYLANAINQKLDNGYKVLWLLSGGSAIQVAVTARKLLHERPLNNLTVGLIDERYGKDGHRDSNWQQLTKAGFKFDDLQQLPVLEGKDMNQTAADYETAITRQLDGSQFSIGLFGIGPDGHTAGILPGSPAATSNRLVEAYQGPVFQRITLTAKAIDRLNEAVVYAVGENKRQALLNLQQDMTISEQPAQALKMVSESTIFNDQIGD